MGMGKLNTTSPNFSLGMAYLKSMGSIMSPACQYGDSPMNVGYHTFLGVGQRLCLVIQMGEIMPDNIMGMMLADEDN